MTKIAVLSDIHANLWALESVMADIRERSPDYLLNLGDSLYGPLDPIGTFKMIMEAGFVSIMGNEDRLIVENLAGKKTTGTLRFVLSILQGEAIEWLKSLKASYSINNLLYMCHGTPFSDSEYLLENIEGGCLVYRGADEIGRLVSGVDQAIILCGHSHRPGIIESGSKLLVNPGSVGCPAFDDNSPSYHRVENFSPKARYSVMNIDSDKIVIEQIALDYDYKTAARQAEANGRSDWAAWLRDGRV